MIKNLTIIINNFLGVVHQEVKEVRVEIVEGEVFPAGLVPDEEPGAATVDAAIAEEGEEETADLKEIAQEEDQEV